MTGLPCSSRMRIWVFLQGAPIGEDLSAGREDDWIYPLEPATEEP